MIEKAGAGKPAPVFFYTVSAFALILSIACLISNQRIMYNNLRKLKTAQKKT